MENKEEEVNAPVINTTKDGIQYQTLTVDGRPFNLYNTDAAYRLEEETFEEYKVRRKFNKQVENLKLSGKLVWESKRFGTISKEKQEMLNKIRKGEA